jgi:hypothetical protein
MELLTKVILVLLYPLLILGRILNTLCGRDPLRVREPKSDTCWIERGPEASRTAYFSEASEQEGRSHGGFGRLATLIILWVSRLFAPPRRSTGENFRAAVDRDQDIPDEVYTLW